MEGGCEKLRCLQSTAENVSSQAAAGNAAHLVDQLNHLSDHMNALLAKTAARQASQLVSTNTYNAQLSRMSHCAPVARKPVISYHMISYQGFLPICLEFTPEAAVGDILVA